MKRSFISILLVVLMAASMMTWASAEDAPAVTYNGTELSYNYDNTGSFGDAFTGMLPGEERTQKIDLINTSGKTADFFMDTQVIKALEDATAASGAAYTVTLVVENGGQVDTIYGGSDGATIGGDEYGLYDMNGSLNDVFMAASVQPGDTAQVRLTLKLDGETGVNSYQSVDGMFRFGFSVLQDDEYKSGVTPPAIRYESVKTGDYSPVAIFVALFAVAAVIIVLILITGRKKRKSGGAN